MEVRVVVTITGLAAIGGSLVCLALLLVGRMFSSPHRSVTKSTWVVLPESTVPEDTNQNQKPVQRIDAKPAEIRIIRPSQPIVNWEAKGDRLVGTYRTPSGTVAGYVKQWQSRNRKFYIISPPQVLRDHANGKRLVHRGGGRYIIVFDVQPQDVDSGIRAVERMLAEANALQRSPRPLVMLRTPRSTSRLSVHPIDRPYWELKHWRANGNRLRGFYRTPHGSIEGYIKHYKSSRPEFFIVNPPQQLRRHKHWICFHNVGSNRYSIHFSPAPSSADAGILEVEKVLAEAFLQQGRRNA